MHTEEVLCTVCHMSSSSQDLSRMSNPVMHMPHMLTNGFSTNALMPHVAS